MAKTIAARAHEIQRDKMHERLAWEILFKWRPFDDPAAAKNAGRMIDCIIEREYKDSRRTKEAKGQGK